ncbi:MAG: hypothetical protein LBD20_00700 [Spirochaetaceae bacterium]|nr:hypothetical protein [Spirochaetaceae bacterium]
MGLFFCGAGALFSAEARPFMFETTPALGRGGFYSAYNTDIFCLLSNPASLAAVQYNGLFQFAPGAIGTFDEDIALLGALIGGESPGASMLDGYGRGNLAQTPPEMYINGPIAAGYAAKGFGLLFFNRVLIDSAIRGQQWTLNLNADFSGNIGWAVCLADTYAHKLDAGLAVKLGVRYTANLLTEPIVVDTNAAGPGGSWYRNDGLMIGAGVNVGLLYSLYNNFSVGLACEDALTPNVFVNLAENGEEAPPFLLARPKINFGISGKPIEQPAVTWVLMCDVRDLLSMAGVWNEPVRNPLLHLSAGTEVILSGSFSLRAGVKDLLPCGGLGYAFGRFSLDGAFYGKEYGLEPGDRSVYALEFCFRMTI